VEEQRQHPLREPAYRLVRRRTFLRFREPQPGAELLVHVQASRVVRLSLQRSFEHAWDHHDHRSYGVSHANSHIHSNADSNTYSTEADRDGDGQADGRARVANSHVLGEAVASRVYDTRRCFDTVVDAEPPRSRSVLIVVTGRRHDRVDSGRARDHRGRSVARRSETQNHSVTHTSHVLPRTHERVN